jgi:hypothetical protein
MASADLQPRTGTFDPQVNADEWQVYRGLARPPAREPHDKRRIVLVAVVALLAATVGVSLVILAGRLRDRVPALYSAARAEVSSFAAKLRTAEAPKNKTTEAVQEVRTRRALRRTHEPRVHEGDALPPLPPFEIYVVDGNRRVLISSMGRVALLDVATGQIRWVPADQDSER